MSDSDSESDMSGVFDDLEFYVMIHRKEGQKIGVDVDKEYPVTVRAVKLEGAIHDWNQENPDSKVGPEDQIISCNGIDGEVHEMIKELATAVKLKLHIRRPFTEMHTGEEIITIRKDSASPLGIDIDQSDELVVKIIKTGGLVAIHNSMNPGNAFDINDVIVKVNAVSRDVNAMVEEMRTASTLVFTVRKCKIAETEPFEVHLSKRPGSKMGIEVDQLENRYLQVKAVKPNGLVAEWNRNNPSYCVKMHQYILMVNGICEDSAEMINEIQSSKELTLEISALPLHD